MYAGLSARLSNMLRLHKPSPPASLSPVEAEHRKRVWWTTYCIDRMTSTEMGLPPIFHPEQVELEYPDGTSLSPEDTQEFSCPHMFATQIQLAFIHADICGIMKRLGRDDTANDMKLTSPIIQRLELLRSKLPPHLSFDLEFGMPSVMQETNHRSLPSMYQRYFQVRISMGFPVQGRGTDIS